MPAVVGTSILIRYYELWTIVNVQCSKDATEGAATPQSIIPEVEIRQADVTKSNCPPDPIRFRKGAEDLLLIIKVIERTDASSIRFTSI